MPEPTTVLHRLLEEAFSQGDLDVCDELVASDVVEHQQFGPDHAAGPEGVKAVVRSLRTAYSDFRLRIEDFSVDGDRIWARCIATGTNDGVFMGHPPTGKTIRIDVFDLVRVRDGKIVEHWGSPDRLGALVQLGLVRPPQASLATPA